MKKTLHILKLALILSFVANFSSAQYCVPTTAIPYNANMPGIRLVQLNTIDRQSLDIENYPSNSYVNTGLSTTLEKGETYPISINTSVDATISPTMNIRVWIDYNQDFDLEDVGETVISVDHQYSGTYTGSFTVPLTALSGPTRMRVTSKMSDLGGHTLPTACDDPPDPYGYHGEIEDYTVEIMGTTDINSVHSSLNSWDVHLGNGMITLQYDLSKSAQVSFDLYNILGEKEFSVEPQQQKSGAHTFRDNFSVSNINSSGIFIAVFNIDGVAGSRKIILND